MRHTISIRPLVARLRRELPFCGSKVAAGFPSPADDWMEESLDLNDRLIHNPAATFLVKVDGPSMIGAGIAPGDMLVVDKSEDAKHGDIVVAVVNGEFTLKRYINNNGVITLVAENTNYSPITFKDGDEMSIWGVVKHCIKDF